jgi:hypothetical protein
MTRQRFKSLPHKFISLEFRARKYPGLQKSKTMPSTWKENLKTMSREKELNLRRGHTEDK